MVEADLNTTERRGQAMKAKLDFLFSIIKVFKTERGRRRQRVSLLSFLHKCEFCHSIQGFSFSFSVFNVLLLT